MSGGLRIRFPGRRPGAGSGRSGGVRGADRCTHPVPNDLSEPSVSFEVTLESNSLSHNNRRQGLYGNGQISWKEKGWEMYLLGQKHCP